MRTVLLLLLTFINHCIGHQSKDKLAIDHSDALPLEHLIKSSNSRNINDQSMPSDYDEKRRLQSEEVLWQINDTQLVSVTDKFVVPTYTEGLQRQIAVKVLPGSNLVYAWASTNLTDNPMVEPDAIKIKMLDGEGEEILPEKRVNPNDQDEAPFSSSSILDIGNNEFMVVWAGQVGSMPIRIYGHCFDSHGDKKEGVPFIISNEAWTFNSEYPNGKCKDNLCVVTWFTFSPNNIYMREIYTNCTIIGDPAIVSVDTVSFKGIPKVVFFRNGNRAIFWVDGRNGNSFDIYAGWFHKNGTRLFEMDLKINNYTLADSSGVTVDGFKKSNRAIIVWQDPVTKKLYYRIVTANGDLGEVEERVNPNSSSQNFFPDVAVLIDDFYGITWSSAVDLEYNAISMQVFKSDTSPIGTEINVTNGTERAAIHTKIDASGHIITVGWQNQLAYPDVGGNVSARILKFFTPTQSPTLSPSLPTTASPTKRPTFRPTPPPTTKAYAWWQKSKDTFFIIMGSAVFILGVVGACYLANKLDAMSQNTISNLHDVELE